TKHLHHKGSANFGFPNTYTYYGRVRRRRPRVNTTDYGPLFTWQPTRQVIVFPMVKRVGRIRDVAIKMLDKPSDRAASHYRHQVTDAMLRGFEKLGIPEDEQ